MKSEQLVKWLKYEIEHAKIMQSKHAFHSHDDPLDNIETWAFFQGQISAFAMVLKEVEKHDI